MTRIVQRGGRTARNADAGSGAQATVIKSSSADDLHLVTLPHVQAAIYHSPDPPPWLTDIARAVETGVFQIERVVLPCVTFREIADWLDRNLPRVDLFPHLHTVGKSEILSLVERERALTRASHFMLRVFTEAPTTRCGFHVDTAVPRAPTVGLLRVFNGPGTEYVDPDNITSMRDFYRYLAQRERLAREMAEAQTRDDREWYDAILNQITSLDARPTFLLRPEDIQVIPTCAIVAFKHVDARIHWSDHAKALAWVHRSPAVGAPRLVVNVTAREPYAHGSSL